MEMPVIDENIYEKTFLMMTLYYNNNHYFFSHYYVFRFQYYFFHCLFSITLLFTLTNMDIYIYICSYKSLYILNYV